MKIPQHTSASVITVHYIYYCQRRHLLFSCWSFIENIARVFLALWLISYVELLIKRVSLGHCGPWTEHNHPPADNCDGSSDAVIIISWSCCCMEELHLNELGDSPHIETQQGNKSKSQTLGRAHRPLTTSTLNAEFVKAVNCETASETKSSSTQSKPRIY